MKIQLQYINKTSDSNKDQTASSNANLSKLKLPNIDHTSALESRPICNFIILTKIQLKNIHQTVVKTFLSISISNSNNINKFWDGIFTCQSHISQFSITSVTEWQDEAIIGLVSDKKSSSKYILFCHTFQQIRLNLVLPDLISARLLFPSNRSEVSCCHIIANMSNLSPARIASFTILLVYPYTHLYYICILYS